MATIDLTPDQVVSLVKQLPSQTKRKALLALADESGKRQQARTAYAEGELRRLAAAQSLDWDKLSDEQREAFVDDLLHEGKACR